jgi:hypothetical protein
MRLVACDTTEPGALRLDFVRDDRIELVHEPSAFAVHAQLDDALVSHLLPVGGYVPA